MSNQAVTANSAGMVEINLRFRGMCLFLLRPVFYTERLKIAN